MEEKLEDKDKKERVIKQKRYVIGVPFPVEDIDDKNKSSWKDEAGIY